MSGHTQFTEWIATKAKYALVDGNKLPIEEVYFISAPGHNNDEVVVMAGGIRVTHKEAWNDWSERFNSK